MWRVVIKIVKDIFTILFSHTKRLYNCRSEQIIMSSTVISYQAVFRHTGFRALSQAIGHLIWNTQDFNGFSFSRSRLALFCSVLQRLRLQSSKLDLLVKLIAFIKGSCCCFSYTVLVISRYLATTTPCLLARLYSFFCFINRVMCIFISFFFFIRNSLTVLIILLV